MFIETESLDNSHSAQNCLYLQNSQFSACTMHRCDD